MALSSGARFAMLALLVALLRAAAIRDSFVADGTLDVGGEELRQDLGAGSRPSRGEEKRGGDEVTLLGVKLKVGDTVAFHATGQVPRWKDPASGHPLPDEWVITKIVEVFEHVALAGSEADTTPPSRVNFVKLQFFRYTDGRKITAKIQATSSNYEMIRPVGYVLTARNSVSDDAAQQSSPGPSTVPLVLPTGWEKKESTRQAGKTYFYNADTGTGQADPPPIKDADRPHDVETSLHNQYALLTKAELTGVQLASGKTVEYFSKSQDRWIIAKIAKVTGKNKVLIEYFTPDPPDARSVGGEVHLDTGRIAPTGPKPGYLVKTRRDIPVIEDLSSKTIPAGSLGMITGLAGPSKVYGDIMEWHVLLDDGTVFQTSRGNLETVEAFRPRDKVRLPGSDLEGTLNYFHEMAPGTWMWYFVEYVGATPVTGMSRIVQVPPEPADYPLDPTDFRTRWKESSILDCSTIFLQVLPEKATTIQGFKQGSIVKKTRGLYKDKEGQLLYWKPATGKWIVELNAEELRKTETELSIDPKDLGPSEGQIEGM